LEIANGLQGALHLCFNPTRWQRWQRARDEFLQALTHYQPTDEAAQTQVDYLRMAADALQLKAIDHTYALLDLTPARALVGNFQNAAESLAKFLLAEAAPSRISAHGHVSSALPPEVSL
jgi:hypothetical protein